MGLHEADILRSLQTLSTQVGALEARIADLDSRIYGLTKVLHIGNGRESVTTRLTRAEDALEALVMAHTDRGKQNRAVFAALVSSLGAVAAVAAQFFLG